MNYNIIMMIVNHVKYSCCNNNVYTTSVAIL